jgi:hypothetical protein
LKECAEIKFGIKLDGTSVDGLRGPSHETAMNARLVGTIAFLFVPGRALAQTGQMQDKTDQTGNETGNQLVR